MGTYKFDSENLVRFQDVAMTDIKYIYSYIGLGLATTCNYFILSDSLQQERV